MGLFGGIAQSAQGTNQTALGIYQLMKAKRLKKDNYVPESLQNNIRQAEALSNKGKYIGQDYDESQVRRNSANAIGSAKEATNSSANLLNTVSAIQSKENDAMGGIANKALQFQHINRMNAQNLRGQRAGIEMDNMKRYWAAKSALKGAGIQNLMQGQASIHQGAGNFLDSMGGGMGGGMMGGGNLASGAGGAQQNNPMTMMPGQTPSYFQNQNQNPYPYFQNQNQNPYPNGMYS